MESKQARYEAAWERVLALTYAPEPEWEEAFKAMQSAKYALALEG